MIFAGLFVAGPVVWTPIPPGHASARAWIQRGVAVVWVRQEVEQPVGPRWRLPAPPGAPVQAVEITCGGRPLEAKLAPTVDGGPAGDELRWTTPAPCLGEDLVVALRYHEAMVPDGDVRTLALPLAAGTPTVAEVALDEWTAIASLWSPTHPIEVDRQEGERVMVRAVAPGPSEPPRSAAAQDPPELVLSWTEAVSCASDPRTFVDGVVLARLPRIRACYERRLRLDPDLAGRVELKFVVERSGAVSDLRVGEDTVGDPAVTQCVSEAVGERYAMRPCARIYASFPFTFRPG